ncbi:hypothetical protein SB912_26380, partial [Pantoea sp. SIMBA_072]
GQALAQGTDGVVFGMLDQVVGDTLGGGREKAAPVAFEVLDGGLVAAPGVVTGGGAKVALDIGHDAGSVGDGHTINRIKGYCMPARSL